MFVRSCSGSVREWESRSSVQHPPIMITILTSGQTQLTHCGDLNVLFRKAIASGFFMQVAHFGDSDKYVTVKDRQQVYLHPSNTLEGKPEW